MGADYDREHKGSAGDVRPDHLTLTVELAVRTLQEDRARMTPEQLPAFLKENRLKQVDMPPVMSGRNREYQSETIYHHIQNLYRISQLHEPAKRAGPYAVSGAGWNGQGTLSGL